MPSRTARARPDCPFCRAHETELLSHFGSQLLTEQWYCRRCHTPFEYIRDAEADTEANRGEVPPSEDHAAPEE